MTTHPVTRIHESEHYTYAYEPAQSGDPRTLIMMHGTGGDHMSFIGLGRLVAPTAALIALKGDVEEFGNLRFFRRLGEGIYDMDDLTMRTHRLADDIPQIISNHGRDPEVAIGVGYSNGANVLANILFETPDRLAGAVIMHPLLPYVPPSPPGLKGKRVLMTYGSHDPISSREHNEEIIARFLARDADLETREIDAGHEVRQPELDAISAWLAAFAVLADA